MLQHTRSVCEGPLNKLCVFTFRHVQASRAHICVHLHPHLSSPRGGIDAHPTAVHKWPDLCGGASVWMRSCWSGNMECEQKSEAPRFCCLFRNTRRNSDISVGIFVSPSDSPSIFCTLKPTWVVLLTHGWTAWVSGGMYQALWQEAVLPFFTFSFQLENVKILIWYILRVSYIYWSP